MIQFDINDMFVRGRLQTLMSVTCVHSQYFFSSILHPHRASSLVQSMEQSPRTFLPLAAVEDRRREIRLEFHNQIQRLRALEKVIQNLLIAGEIFENLEHDVGWYFKPEPELFRDIVEVRGKVASIVTRLNPEMDAMTNALWNRFGAPASASESVAPKPETTS